MRVLRDRDRDSNSDCIMIDGEPYFLSKTYENICKLLITSTYTTSNGRVLHGYAHAPIYFSGSPYADVLKKHGVRMEKIPVNFRAECTIYIKYNFNGKKPKWAEILNVDHTLLENFNL